MCAKQLLDKVGQGSNYHVEPIRIKIIMSNSAVIPYSYMSRIIHFIPYYLL